MGNLEAPNLEWLMDLSTKFRKAILESDVKKMLVSFENFPRGSCGDASILLGTYLQDMGCGTFDYVFGSKGRQSHAWVQKGNIIIDITADQFDDISDSVIVTTDNTWHKKFNSYSHHPTNFHMANIDYYVGTRKLDYLAAYQEILSHLDQTYLPKKINVLDNFCL